MKYKGEIEGFPEEVVEAMLNEMERQHGYREISVLENCKSDGFSWDCSKDGQNFWYYVIQEKDFDLFFKKYPKKHVYPKVMLVSDDQKEWIQRVVFMEKNDKYIAWTNAETLKDAETIYCSVPWKHAKDIEEKEEEQIVELTFKQISEGKGVGVPHHLLRIKE